MFAFALFVVLYVAFALFVLSGLSQRRGPMPEIVAAVVASQLTQGLQYAATRQRPQRRVLRVARIPSLRTSAR